MPYRPHWKTTLYTTTALIGVATFGICAPLKTQAAPVIINGASGQVTLQNADTVTITGTGVISAGGTGILGPGGVIATSITNAGTIGGGYGVFLSNGASLTGGLTNSGNIDGGSIGIFLSSGARLTNGLTNSGTIDGDFNGINLLSGSVLDSLVNQASGRILATGSASAYAVYLNNSTITGGITNAGTIDGGYRGIFLGNASLGGGLTNSGTIAGTYGIYLQGGATLSNGLTNSGTINGSTYGINLQSGATLTGGITNSGTIDGGSAGINLQNGSLTGGLTNSGMISGSNRAIYLSNSILTNGLINSGTISEGNRGIFLVGAGLTGGLTNSGMIDGGVFGINLLSFATISGGVTNSGTIDGGSHGIFLSLSNISGGVTNSGTIDGGSAGIFLSLSNISGGVTNSGTIAGTYGIYLQVGATLSNGLTNSGMISGSNRAIYLSNSILTNGLINSGTIDGGSAGIYLFSNASLAGGITNSGTITGGGSAGIYLQNNASLTGGLTNSGTIDGGNHGIHLANATTLSGGLTNSGTIDGGSYGIYLRSNASLTGGLTNSGTIIGGMTIDGTSTIDSLILNGGRIIGNVIDAAPASGSDVVVNGAFTTEGNFSVSSLTVNNGTSLTLDVGDSFTSYDNAVINGTLTFNVTDTAHYGSLVVSNGTADLTNATLTVGVIGSGLAAGDEIRVINGNTAIIGGPGATPMVIADNSYLWNFEAFDGTAATAATNNTDLFIRAVQDTTATEAASTPNNEAAGQVLQDIALTTNDPTLQQIIANVNNAPTQQAVNDILESTTPTIDTAVSDATSAIAHQSVDMINARLSDLRAGSGISSGHLTDSLAIWGQVFGQHASQDERDNIAGYDANTYGFVGGIDTDHLFDNATIGLAVSYGNSAIKSKDANSTRTDINSYQIGLYGDYNLPQNYFISGSVAYGYNDINSTRHDVGAIAGLNATADYKADQYTAHVEAGRDFSIKQAYAPTITPTIGATYTHLSPDSYTETGAGGASLSVETDTIESFELGLGIQSKWDIKQTNGSILSPSVHAGYRYDIIGDTIQSTSNFTGASFNTQGADPAQGTANIGTGLQYKATNNWTLSAGYDFEIRQDYTAHAAIVRAVYGF